jgi:XRE family transcriptional regulator, regulator of sulfur utilization
LVNNKKMSYAKLVGVHLKRRRDEFGMTQAEFGEKIGLSEKGVGRLERGERAPSCRTLHKIQIKGEFSIDRLLKDVEKDKHLLKDDFLSSQTEGLSSKNKN